MKTKWSLVIHEATSTSVNIWLGCLFDKVAKPEHCQLVLLDNNKQEVARYSIDKADWNKPFSKVAGRFFILHAFDNLLPDTHYFVNVINAKSSSRAIDTSDVFAQGEFSSLPSSLSSTKPFVAALGSCFFDKPDKGAVACAYQRLYFKGEAFAKPDVKFLTGDQVYLDIGFDAFCLLPHFIRRRIANDYARVWQQQADMLRYGATWFLPDDHDYWNNYPYIKSGNPYSIPLSFDYLRKTWGKTAIEGVANVQKVALLRTFSIGNDVSFCFADTRSKRKFKEQPDALMPAEEFSELLIWARTLTCPGVLVLPQPLLVDFGEYDDLTLVDYQVQYQQLVTALASTGHDILCLSGDVHFGRIAEVEFGEAGAILHEVISSPMSNLTSIEGKIAASKPEKLDKFPVINIDGISPKKVSYPANGFVSTKKMCFLKCWPYEKTLEHFMTLGFSKKGDNVKVVVQAWLVREQDKITGLPKADFDDAHEIILKKRHHDRITA